MQPMLSLLWLIIDICLKTLRSVLWGNEVGSFILLAHVEGPCIQLIRRTEGRRYLGQSLNPSQHQVLPQNTPQFYRDLMQL